MKNLNSTSSSTLSTSAKKLRIMVLYGGRSGEHEISLRSAASVIRYLDRTRFDVIPVGIDKKGVWRLGDFNLIEESLSNKLQESLVIYENAPVVVVGDFKSLAIDAVFPVMHGPLCEDGAIQGLFELAEIPYVGSGVLGSAAGMDKDVSKRLARDGGLKIVPYISLKRGRWQGGSSVGDSDPASGISASTSSGLSSGSFSKTPSDVPAGASVGSPEVFAEVSKQVVSQLGYPVFVKPANLGSSVGVHKVKESNGLRAALKDAFRYDTKVLIEKAINAREIEFAVLEASHYGDPAKVSLAGEIAPTHEFYSYEAKYLDEQGAKLMIPAELEPKQMALGQKIAREAFELIECEGMARVDLFLDKDSGEFYFNEVNTIPGFTSISMYPKLWEHSGVAYGDLLTRLIDLALARHGRKGAFVREYHG